MAENQSSDFSEKKPSDLVLSLAPVGRSGTLVTAELIDNEYLSELSGLKGQETYDKMLRSDSQIRKIYHAVNNPIKSAKWDIEPASSEAFDLEVAAKIKHIIFNNISWKNKLDEILTFAWHGHAVFEVIHKNFNDKEFGAYTGLLALGFRDQRTLDKWKFENDELVAIHQLQQGDISVNAWMPRDTLLIFFNEKKGNDNGYPFLRMVYGNYKRKLLYKQLQAIGIERGAIAVPKLKVPKEIKPDSDEWLLAEDQLKAFSQAESAYFMYPEGFELDFNQTNSFDPSRVQTAIKAENEEIVGSLVAMFLEMGIGGNSGNQAGTEVSASFFRDGIKYLADKITEEINLHLIPNLVRLNYGDKVTVLPKMIHAGINDQAGKELMEIITGYASKGVITLDEQLEDYVRKQHDLPKKAAGELLDNKKEEKNTVVDDSEDDTEDTKEVQLSEGGNNPTVKLMSGQAELITNVIKNSMRFSGKKFIADTINRYKQLPTAKKQTATSKVSMGGSAKFKDGLKSVFAETINLAIKQAEKEISKGKEVKLSSSDFDMKRMSEKYGDYSDVKLNELSKFPAHIQVLIAKQAELITNQSLDEITAKLSFSFSSIELKSNDEDVIEQNMTETLEDFVEGATIGIKGENSAALMVNEGRNSVFFDPENENQIHSYTFMNDNPKSAICRELAGITFNTNDVESLRYSPPLHHNCKSYLRANLKTSRGLDKLEVSTLSPTPEGVKSITL